MPPHCSLAASAAAAAGLRPQDHVGVIGAADACFFLADPAAAATHVPESLVVTEGGRRRVYVFYACQAGGEPYHYRYKRIRWMRRPIDATEVRSIRELLRSR